jgi:hypothetical protein
VFVASTSTEILEHLQETLVTIEGYFYRADFGPEVSPRFHAVDCDQRCTCPLGESCPAVLAVIEYLAAGGEPPPEPPQGYYPVAPAYCPICGAAAFFYLKLSSRVRGAGWRCTQSGSAHYWVDRGNILAEKFAQNKLLKPIQSDT